MHEFSVASELVRTVEEAFNGSGATTPVTVVNVIVGKLSGVVPDYLKHYYEIITKDNPMLSGAEVRVEIQEVEAICADCDEVFGEDSFVLACPKCSSTNVVIRKGRELMVDSIEIDDGGEE